jgi:hypothetical protein
MCCLTKAVVLSVLSKSVHVRSSIMDLLNLSNRFESVFGFDESPAGAKAVEDGANFKVQFDGVRQVLCHFSPRVKSCMSHERS